MYLVENMNFPSVCTLCFSKDRKLYLITSSENNFFNVLSPENREFIQALQSSTALKLCFECQGRLKTAQTFIEMGRQSIGTLIKYCHSPNSTPLVCTSTLSITEIIAESITGIEMEIDVNYLNNDVKLESFENTQDYLDIGDTVVSELHRAAPDLPTAPGHIKEEHTDRDDAQMLAHEEKIKELILNEIEGRHGTTNLNTEEEINADSRMIKPSTSTPLEDLVDVRSETTTSDSLKPVKKCNTKKVATTKPKGPLTKWINIWVTEEQALSWYLTEVDRQTSTENTCVCDHCKEGFTGKDELEKHVFRFHFDRQKLVCSICKYRFTTFRVMHKHMKHHYILYRCKMCDYNTRDLNLIQTHTGPDHKTVGKESWQISTDSPAIILHWCKKCGVYFVSEMQFLTHSQKYGCRRIYMKCDFCSDVFIKFSLRKDHMQRFHNKQPPERKPRGKNKRKTHKRQENDQDGAFYCQLCDKFYQDIRLYKTHVETSAKHVKTADRIQCPHCDRSYPTKYLLNNHIKVIHLNIRNFKCSECPKAYASRRKMELHFDRKHNKDFVPVKDKICDLCGAAFETNAMVKEHRRSHTGERPYKCKLCPSTFSYSGAFYTHNKLVHLKKKTSKNEKK